MKTHLYRPGETISICGRNPKQSTHKPTEVDCKSCKWFFENNISWFWRERHRLWLEGVIAHSGVLRRKDDVLWEGRIPIVAGFNMDAVHGHASASEVDGQIKIELTLSKHNAEIVKDFLKHRVPFCLSWATNVPSGHIGELIREKHQNGIDEMNAGYRGKIIGD